MSQIARRLRAAVSASPLLSQAAESGWTTAQRAMRGRKLRAYTATHGAIRLMIGSGPSRLQGWLATDLLPSRPDVVLLDANERFPFDDGVVHRIHTEHMIEHVDHAIGARMLAECARVLQPGGRIRIATPDFDQAIALAVVPSPEEAELARASNLRNGIDPAVADDPVFAVNRLFSGYGHRFLYSEPALQRALETAGFTDVTRQQVGRSDDPEFALVDQHSEQIDTSWNEYQTLVLEAVRPGPAP